MSQPGEQNENAEEDETASSPSSPQKRKETMWERLGQQNAPEAPNLAPAPHTNEALQEADEYAPAAISGAAAIANGIAPGSGFVIQALGSLGLGLANGLTPSTPSPSPPPPPGDANVQATAIREGGSDDETTGIE